MTDKPNTDSTALGLLGLTQEELRDQVIDRAAHMLRDDTYDNVSGELRRKFADLVRLDLDALVRSYADEKILPLIKDRVQDLVLQSTNGWGEKTGEPVTFVEYMIKRAEAWITDKVDYNGKKPEYSSTGVQTRIAWMVESHLHHQIKTAMETALKDANTAIAKGLYETVRLKLNEVLASIKIGVTTK